MNLSKQINSAATYLQTHFNPSVGLIHEAPKVNPDLYWFQIDNYLAAQALKLVDMPPTEQLSTLIQSTFNRYGPIPAHGRVEILFDEPQPEPFLYGIHWAYFLKGEYHDSGMPGSPNNIMPFSLETEICDGKDYRNIQKTPNGVYLPILELETPDEAQHIGEALTYGNFGDILCYAAMNRRLGAKPPFSFWNPSTWIQPTAEQLLAQANALWDEVGINDKYRQTQPDGHYATYKLALNIIANLKFDSPPVADITSTMLNMQNSDGGFITDYLPNRTPIGDTNCETTSMCLLALILESNL